VSEVKDFSEKTDKMARGGRDMANEALAKLEVVKAKLGESAAAVEGLGVKSSKISSIVDVITSIPARSAVSWMLLLPLQTRPISWH